MAVSKAFLVPKGVESFRLIWWASAPEFLSLALYSLDLLELSARPRADRSIRLGQASGSPWSVFVSLCIRTATRIAAPSGRR